MCERLAQTTAKADVMGGTAWVEQRTREGDIVRYLILPRERNSIVATTTTRSDPSIVRRCSTLLGIRNPLANMPRKGRQIYVLVPLVREIRRLDQKVRSNLKFGAILSVVWEASYEVVHSRRTLVSTLFYWRDPSSLIKNDPRAS